MSNPTTGEQFQDQAWHDGTISPEVRATFDRLTPEFDRWTPDIVCEIAKIRANIDVLTWLSAKNLASAINAELAAERDKAAARAELAQIQHCAHEIYTPMPTREHELAVQKRALAAEWEKSKIEGWYEGRAHERKLIGEDMQQLRQQLADIKSYCEQKMNIGGKVGYHRACLLAKIGEKP